MKLITFSVKFKDSDKDAQVNVVAEDDEQGRSEILESVSNPDNIVSIIRQKGIMLDPPIILGISSDFQDRFKFNWFDFSIE